MSVRPVEGALVDQRYELLKREPDRGLGASWQARDTKFKSRLVTVKFLRALDPGVAPLGALPKALDDHLQAVRRLRHEGVLTVVNHGLWGELPYVVHETFDGRSLGAGLDEARATGEAFPVALLQALFEKLAATVRFAHDARPPVLHLGLSPGNVLVRRAPGQPFLVKLLDFGIAPWASPDPSAPARSARAITLPAPEQLAHPANQISERTDVFSLGCLLREMLALPPAAGETLSPAGMERRRPDVPEPVWDVIATATHPSPNARFASVDAMLEPLRAAWMVPVPPPPIPVRIEPSPTPSQPASYVAPPRLDAPMPHPPRAPVSEASFVPFVLPPLPGVPSPGADYASTLAIAERAPAPTPWDADVLSAMIDLQSHGSVERVSDFLQRMQAQARASAASPSPSNAPGQTLAIDAPSWSSTDGATLAVGANSWPSPDGATLSGSPSQTPSPYPIQHADSPATLSSSPPLAALQPWQHAPHPQPLSPPAQRAPQHQPSAFAPQPPSRAWIGVVAVCLVATAAVIALLAMR